MFKLNRKSLIIGGVAVALLGTSAIAVKANAGGDRAGHIVERVSDHLELQANQKTAFEKVVGSYSSMRADTPEFLLDMSSKVKDLAADETLTVEEVNTLRDQIKAEFDRRVDVLVPEFVAFYNTLDDDQREVITSRLDKVSERFEHRLEKRSERTQASDGN